MKPRVFRPAEIVFAAANLAFAFIWATAGRNVTDWPVWMIAHLGIAFGAWLFARVPGPSRPGAVALRDIYPLFGIALFWTEIGIVNRARPESAFHDAWVAHLDQRLFPMHPHAAWKLAAPGIASGMDALYLGYYLLVFGLPIWFLIRRRRHALRDTAYRLLATYVGCDLLYALFPAHGPRAALGDAGTGTWLSGIEASLRAAGDSPGTAFPSSHVAGVFVASFIAWRWLPRPMARLWLFAACGVALSTVYTQNHYAIDVIYGIAWAVVCDRVLPRAGVSDKEAERTLDPRFPRAHPERVLAREIALPRRMTS